MHKKSVRIISDYRNPNENEFFFHNNPFNSLGFRELAEYLEETFDIRFEEIEGWKMKSTVQEGYSDNYAKVNYGLRVVKK